MQKIKKNGGQFMKDILYVHNCTRGEFSNVDLFLRLLLLAKCSIGSL